MTYVGLLTTVTIWRFNDVDSVFISFTIFRVFLLFLKDMSHVIDMYRLCRTDIKRNTNLSSTKSFQLSKQNSYSIINNFSVIENYKFYNKLYN